MTTSIPLSRPWIDTAEIDRVTRALTGRLSGDRPSAALAIYPSFTFASTANAILRTGTRPVLADIEPRTLGLDAADVAGRMTSRTRAMIVIEEVRRTPARPEP